MSGSCSAHDALDWLAAIGPAVAGHCFICEVVRRLSAERAAHMTSTKPWKPEGTCGHGPRVFRRFNSTKPSLVRKVASLPRASPSTTPSYPSRSISPLTLSGRVQPRVYP